MGRRQALWEIYCLHEEKIDFMENIFGRTLPELTELAVSLGMPKFRGKQLAEWLYKKSVTDFAAMQNLPNDIRSNLAPV